MAERPDPTRIRQAIEGFNQGHPELFMDLMADDVVFHVPGNSPVAGYIFRFANGTIVEATNLQQDQDQIDRFWSA